MQEKNIFTPWHEILATGCIQAPPKASDLFHRVARRAAFHFALNANFCFGAAKFFFGEVEEELDFGSACFAPACEEAA
jgi:hypothetical protein